MIVHNRVVHGTHRVIRASKRSVREDKRAVRAIRPAVMAQGRDGKVPLSRQPSRHVRPDTGRPSYGLTRIDIHLDRPIDVGDGEVRALNMRGWSSA